MLSITGLTAYTHKLAIHLAAVPDEAALKRLHQSIAASARRLEISINVKRITPAQLTAKSRALRGWLNLLSDDGALTGYVNAVRTATPIFESALAQQTRFTPPAQIFFLPLRGLYRLRQRRSSRGPEAPLEIFLPTPALAFEDADFTALARSAILGDPRSKRHVLDAMKSEAAIALAAELDALGGTVDESRGSHHDLAASFARVTAQYFPRGIAKPKLFWSKALTHRKFGHYDWVNDAIMISRTLDAPAVPDFLVDFVMYHELLHKAHGLRWSGARSYAHTAAFYADERKFARHAEAEAALTKLAAAARRRR
jgi:hypothetical protein